MLEGVKLKRDQPSHRVCHFNIIRDEVDRILLTLLKLFLLALIFSIRKALLYYYSV